jgi:hypothetical protein
MKGFNTVKSTLTQYLTSWNTQNPNAQAEVVLGVVDAAISNGFAANCGEGLATVGTRDPTVGAPGVAVFRAIPDPTVGPPSSSGGIASMELAHTFGLIANPIPSDFQAEGDPFNQNHSQDLYGDGSTSGSKAYNVPLAAGGGQTPFLSPAFAMMDFSQPTYAYNNYNTLFEKADWSYLLCRLGGPATSPSCLTPATIRTGVDPTVFSLNGITDGTPAGTNVVESFTGGGASAPAPASSPYHIQEFQGSNVLHDYPVEVKFTNTEHGAGANPVGPGLVSIAVDYDPLSTSVRFLTGPTVLYSALLNQVGGSPAPPQPTLTDSVSTTCNESSCVTMVTLTVTSTEPPGGVPPGNQKADLDIVGCGGFDFPAIVGLPLTNVSGNTASATATIETSLACGEISDPQLQANVTDGIQRVASNKISYFSNANSPNAAIYSPIQNTTFLQDNTVSLVGAGVDPQDGEETGTSLSWYVNGFFVGNGSPVFVSTGLTIGTNTVELRVRNSNGQVAKDFRQFTVLPDSDHDGIADTCAANGDPFGSLFNDGFDNIDRQATTGDACTIVSSYDTSATFVPNPGRAPSPLQPGVPASTIINGGIRDPNQVDPATIHLHIGPTEPDAISPCPLFDTTATGYSVQNGRGVARYNSGTIQQYFANTCRLRGVDIPFVVTGQSLDRSWHFTARGQFPVNELF